MSSARRCCHSLVVIPTRSRAHTPRAALTSASSPNTSTEVMYALLSVCTSTSVLLLLLQLPRKWKTDSVERYIRIVTTGIILGVRRVSPFF